MSEPKPKMSPEDWDQLIDQLFDLDLANPYFGQTVEDEGVENEA